MGLSPGASDLSLPGRRTPADAAAITQVGTPILPERRDDRGRVTRGGTSSPFFAAPRTELEPRTLH
jgi:hypothetical protein